MSTALRSARQALRLLRGPLAAAVGIALFAVSRRWTLWAVLGPGAAWPAGVAVLPFFFALLEARWLDRFGQAALTQRVLDGHAWLAVCAVELGFRYFASSLGTFLPALGLSLVLVDAAWVLSGWRTLASGPRLPLSVEPGPEHPDPSLQPPGTRPQPVRPAVSGPPGTARRIWLAGLLFGLVVPSLQLSGLLDRHKTFTGDEPAYLLVSLSLLEDGDLLMNNQYRAQEYTRFGTTRYPVFAHPGADGRLYPHHNAGLPVLLVPALALGLGFDDPDLLMLVVRGFMALLAALAVAEVALLGMAVGGTRRAGVWSGALAGLTVPFAFYATQVYPEAPAALFGVLAYRRILSFEPRTQMKPVLIAGLSAGVLVWLHYKFLPLAALLGLCGALRPLRVRQRAMFLLVLAVPAALFFLFVHAHYGVWSPAALQLGAQAVGEVDNAGPETMAERLRHSPLNFLGYFFDQRIGLFLYAPVYLLLVPGCAVLAARSRRLVFELLALGLTPLAMYAWIYWSMGGYGPPNRPAVPGIPFLAVLAGLACAAAPSVSARRLRDLLWIPTLMVVLALLLHHDALYHPMSVRSDAARNRLLVYHGPSSVDVTSWFPAYLGDSQNPVPNATFPLAGLALALVLLRLWRLPTGSMASRVEPRAADAAGADDRGTGLARPTSDAGAQSSGGLDKRLDSDAGAPSGRSVPRPDDTLVDATKLAATHADLVLGRSVLGVLAVLLLLVRLDAIERTPLEVERGEKPDALVLGGDGWVDSPDAIWVRGGGWARLLVAVPEDGPVRFQVGTLGPNRVAIRSGSTQLLDMPGPGSTTLDLPRPWRLRRGGRSFVLLEAACSAGVGEPAGSRWLGVRLGLAAN